MKNFENIKITKDATIKKALSYQDLIKNYGDQLENVEKETTEESPIVLV